MASLETIYGDKNLAPGTHLFAPNFYKTEETQTFEDDLCHNVLTGKVLPPAPIDIPQVDCFFLQSVFRFLRRAI